MSRLERAQRAIGERWDVFLWQRTVRRGVRLGKVTTTDHTVALALAEHADHGTPHGARPMTYTLARQLGIHKDTVTDSLRRLERAGLVATVKRGGGTGASARGSLRDLTLPDWALEAAEAEGHESDMSTLNSRRHDREMPKLTAELTVELTVPGPPHTEPTEPTTSSPPTPQRGARRRRRPSIVRDANADHWANGGGFSSDDATTTTSGSTR
ncbi:hypothetical protein [Nocardioides pakistanensis]